MKRLMRNKNADGYLENTPVAYNLHLSQLEVQLGVYGPYNCRLCRIWS
jgi:hypothetical protein